MPAPPEPASPRVAVVIPTVGRASLARAVDSARAQTHAPAEVVVVCDRPGAVAEVPGARVISTSGGVGPAGARAAGVAATTAPLIAFLDDDDTWSADKLSRQVAALQAFDAQGLLAVVSCRVLVVDESGNTRATVPVAPRDGRPWREWAFRRTTLRPVGFALGSSTLLFPRALLDRVPVDNGLTLHEDWDLVLRAAAFDDVVVEILDEPLVRYLDAGAQAGASRPGSGTDRSRAWVDASGLGSRERGDLLLTVTAGLALHEHGRRAALRELRHARRTAAPGGPAVLGLLLQVGAPATVLRRAATLMGRERG